MPKNNTQTKKKKKKKYSYNDNGDGITRRALWREEEEEETKMSSLTNREACRPKKGEKKGRKR